MALTSEEWEQCREKLWAEGEEGNAERLAAAGLLEETLRRVVFPGEVWRLHPGDWLVDLSSLALRPSTLPLALKRLRATLGEIAPQAMSITETDFATVGALVDALGHALREPGVDLPKARRPAAKPETSLPSGKG